MSTTKIEWTEATWNPVVGCSILSPGCTNCYAMKMAARIEAMGNQPRYAGTTRKVNGNAVWTGKVSKAPKSTWYAPIERKRPTMYFVNSMSDLFHEDIPDDWILDALTVMAISHQHTFQLLTKRAARMREFMSRPDLLEQIYLNWYGWSGGAREVRSWPLHNLWLGVSTERQQEADERIPHLLQTPAAVRFISAEPLLGPIDLTALPFAPGFNSSTLRFSALRYFPPMDWRGLDWVITGGESGSSARPSHPQWFRDIRDACASADVAYFHKQNGEWAPGECASKAPTRTERIATWFDDRWILDSITPSASEETHHDDAPDVYRLGKKAAGRLLDGRTHDAMPESAS